MATITLTNDETIEVIEGHFYQLVLVDEYDDQYRVICKCRENGKVFYFKELYNQQKGWFYSLKTEITYYKLDKYRVHKITDITQIIDTITNFHDEDFVASDMLNKNITEDFCNRAYAKAHNQKTSDNPYLKRRIEAEEKNKKCKEHENDVDFLTISTPWC